MDFVFFLYNFILFIMLGVITQLNYKLKLLQTKTNNNNNLFFNSNKIHSKVEVSFDTSDFSETE